MAFEFTDNNFQEKAIENKGVTVIDFWAEWCGPCRMVGPIIDELSEDLDGQVLVGKVDVDTNPETSKQALLEKINSQLVSN
jgi:thioredoxin 1